MLTTDPDEAKAFVAAGALEGDLEYLVGPWIRRFNARRLVGHAPRRVPALVGHRTHTSAAWEVCRAIKDHVAHGGNLIALGEPVGRAYAEWVSAHSHGKYADGHAQATCRAIGEHVRPPLPWPLIAETYQIWLEIQDDLAALRHCAVDGGGQY